LGSLVCEYPIQDGLGFRIFTVVTKDVCCMQFKVGVVEVDTSLKEHMGGVDLLTVIAVDLGELARRGYVGSRVRQQHPHRLFVEAARGSGGGFQSGRHGRKRLA
jgi:hypothetical protein